MINDDVSVRRGTRPLSLTVLVISSIGIILYLNGNREILTSLATVSISLVALLVLLQTLLLTMNGLFLHAFAQKFNVSLRGREWFGLAFVTTLVNYLTPISGGLVARAAYLKRRHAFPLAQFASLVASNYLINFGVISLVGLSVTLLFQDNESTRIMMLFFSTILAGTMILLYMPIAQIRGNSWFHRLVNTVLLGWNQVKNDRRLLFTLLLYTAINILLNGLAFWIAYRAFDFSVSFLTALLISLVAAFSIVIKLTPANIGVQEAIIAVTAGLIGARAEEGLLVALLLRATMIVPVFVLGPIFSYLLTHEMASHQHDQHMKS